MRIFICNRSNDLEESLKIQKEFLEKSLNSIIIFEEIKNSVNWKLNIEKKFEKVDFVIFLIGKYTFKSSHIKYEFVKAKKMYKTIIFIKLNSCDNQENTLCQGYPIFDTVSQCFEYLKREYIKQQNILLEQYKIMVSSTEKVTEQRLKVNNLFFTVISSVLSLIFLVGKSLDFSIGALFGMLFFTIMALLISISWEKLVGSYGKLNKGKFLIINKLENQLKSNIFEEEWKILVNKIQYESNTETEIKIIKIFRISIYFLINIEIIYLFYKIYKQFCY